MIDFLLFPIFHKSHIVDQTLGVCSAVGSEAHLNLAARYAYVFEFD